MQEKTSGTQGNHGGPIASEDSTLGDAYLKQ